MPAINTTHINTANTALAPVTEALILAGGLGTRLQQSVPNVPKCLAPVAGKPFLTYVIDALRVQGIQHFIFSLGYKAGQVISFLQQNFPTLLYTIITEDTPLGTGGAIQKAIVHANTETVLVANGDTLFKVDVWAFEKVHAANKSHCTLALKPMENFDRYGAVQMDGDKIVSFAEKKFYTEGLINGGIYLLNKNAFLQKYLPPVFSFERDYLERFAGEGHFFGSIQQGYFIDIGVPADFAQAQKDFQKPMLHLNSVDKSWTLFLDRDGVINVERPGRYVLHPGAFLLSDGVPEALPLLQQKFGRIIVVTNQRGVTKGLMTEADLTDVHSSMLQQFAAAGFAVDAIYYCLDKEETAPFRKPNPGMAGAAFRDFPQIDPAKTIMVGNKPSDMRFGRAAGIYTVFVTTTNLHEPFPHPDVDLRFDGLPAFARALQS